MIAPYVRKIFLPAENYTKNILVKSTPNHTFLAGGKTDTDLMERITDDTEYECVTLPLDVLISISIDGYRWLQNYTQHQDSPSRGWKNCLPDESHPFGSIIPP
jgi:hypothetical protein